MRIGRRFTYPLLLTAAIACTFPLWLGEWFQSHEGQNYPIRAAEVASEIRRTWFYPSWAPDFHGGYGSPFFIFYAPLAFLIAGYLGAFVMTPTAGLKVVVTFAACAAAIGVYEFIRNFTDKDEAAILASVLFLFAPYRIQDLTVRGDIAEQLALGLLPVALAFYQRAFQELSRSRLVLWGGLAALAHAGVLLAHTLTGIWGTGLIAILFAMQVRKRWFWRTTQFAVGSAAFATSFGVAAFYLLPAFFEKGQVSTHVMIWGAFDPVNNWTPMKALVTGELFGDIRLAFLCSLTLILVTYLRAGRGLRDAWGWFAVACGLVFLVLPVASPIWASRYLPFGSYIQFPWRLLGHASLAFSLAAGIAAARLPSGYRADSAVWIAAAIAALWGGAHLAVTPDVAMNPGPAEIRRLNTETTYLNEYLPQGATATGLRPGLIAEAPSMVIHGAGGFGTKQRLKFTAVKPATIVLSLYDYPGWTIVRQEGPAQVALGSTAAKLVTVKVTQPGTYSVQLDFDAGPLRLFGLLVTILSLLMLWPLLHQLAHQESLVAGIGRRRPLAADRQNG